MVCIYIAGFSSGAGKSSVCQALLEYLIEHHPSLRLAYIKPVTQCEAVTPVAEFCQRSGITAVPVGPVVFRSGVTNDVIQDDAFVSRRSEMLAAAAASVAELHKSHDVVVVDGVGYPSVGSCCGVGNGDVAAAINANVVLVGPNGLGDAIDTVELMLQYFSSKGCDVSGVLFNKVKDTARHARTEVEPIIRKYFAELHRDRLQILGFVPADAAAFNAHLRWDLLKGVF